MSDCRNVRVHKSVLFDLVNLCLFLQLGLGLVHLLIQIKHYNSLNRTHYTHTDLLQTARVSGLMVEPSLGSPDRDLLFHVNSQISDMIFEQNYIFVHLYEQISARSVM